MRSKCEVTTQTRYGRCLQGIAWVLAAVLFVPGTKAVAQSGGDGVSSETATPSQTVKSTEKKPKIAKFPKTPVWSSSDQAEKYFAGFSYIGEYVKEHHALQVTPSGDRFYLSQYKGGLPGDGWDGGPIAHEWIELEQMQRRLAGWKKIDRSQVLIGKQPPEDAIVLFNGTDTKHWHKGKIENRFLKAGTGTKRKFTDFHLYLEFLVPLKPEPPISHPHRGNSGVFALGAYEVQIADTFGLDPEPSAWNEIELLKPVDTWCGSIYGIRAAQINMCLPPLSWQSMEIDFTAARFDGAVKASPAVISVTLNGVKIHDKVILPEGTGGGPSGPRPEVAEGPIYLQNHGNPNLFRNIWIVPR